MRDDVVTTDIPAGDFAAWLRDNRNTQRHGGVADVPCGACTACCTASYFIHVAPDEAATLARIPKALLFPAPGLPKGNVVLGYDAKGHCPMLVDQKCSIYADRPRTCRSYDCRVFSAAGIEAGDDAKVLINQRVRRWQWSFLDEDDRREYAAVQAAARFLRDHADSLPDSAVPANETQLALLALKVYDVFVSGRSLADHEVALAVMERTRQFDAERPRGKVDMEPV